MKNMAAKQSRASVSKENLFCFGLPPVYAGVCNKLEIAVLLFRESGHFSQST